jgi:hypothetical protein
MNTNQTTDRASITSYDGITLVFDRRYYDLVNVHQDSDRMISCMARTVAAAKDLAATSEALGARVRRDGRVVVAQF